MRVDGERRPGRREHFSGLGRSGTSLGWCLNQRERKKPIEEGRRTDHLYIARGGPEAPKFHPEVAPRSGPAILCTLHRAPLARDPRVLSGRPLTALGFWSGRVLATGTAWAGLCLIHHHYGPAILPFNRVFDHQGAMKLRARAINQKSGKVFFPPLKTMVVRQAQRPTLSLIAGRLHFPRQTTKDSMSWVHRGSSSDGDHTTCGRCTFASRP